MNNLKGIGIVALVFILVVIASRYDIFSINPGGINGTSVAPVFYGLIGIVLIFVVYLYSNRKK